MVQVSLNHQCCQTRLNFSLTTENKHAITPNWDNIFGKPATATQDSRKAIEMTPWGMLWQLKTIMCNNSIFHSCNNWGQRLLKHVHNFERFFPIQSECYRGNTHFQQLQPQQVTSPGMISSSLISHTSWQQWFDHSWKYPHVWKVSCFFRWQLITLQSRDNLDSSQNK